MAVLSTLKNTSVSIVIVTYNDPGNLETCLSSLYQNSNGLNFELTVVNNGRRLPEDIKNKFPEMALLENKKNLGFAKAVNRGINCARAEYILVVNSDTILLPNSITPLLDFMKTRPKAAACAGMITNPQGRIQPTCRRFPKPINILFNRTSLLTKLFSSNLFSKHYLLSNWNHQDIRCIDWVCGAYMLLRKDAVKDVGILDEGYFMYCEDVDWCLRAKRKGWKIYYLPQARLIHSNNCDRHTLKKIYYHYQSLFRFHKKYYTQTLRRPLKDLAKTRRVSGKLPIINA